MNEPMRSLRAAADGLIAAGELHPDLIELLNAGLTAADGGIYFTSYLQGNGHLLGVGDLTGQQALINKLHLDDFVDVGRAGWEVICVAQGVLLARRVIDSAAALSPLPVDVVISVDSGGPWQVGDSVFETIPSSTFRFFVHRDDEPWMSEDLDGYSKPMALLQRR